MASRYDESTRAVSSSDSPRDSCISSCSNGTEVPPSCAIATANDTRVRVEGFLKRRPSVRPGSRGS